MDRRSFIKAVSVFVAAATAAPKSLAIQPVDWQKWNEFELMVEDEQVTRLLINTKDFTDSLEARQMLAEVLRFEEDGIVFGRGGQEKWVIAEKLPERFIMGFALAPTPNGPPPVVHNVYAIL